MIILYLLYSVFNCKVLIEIQEPSLKQIKDTSADLLSQAVISGLLLLFIICEGSLRVWCL